MIVLSQRWRKARSVSLVPLIDILFILLIYFMVTSVYLDLDMIPVSETGAQSEQSAVPSAQGTTGATVLVRIDRGGDLRLRGRIIGPDQLATLLATQRAANPDLSVSILPSPYAPVQALASALDAVASAGVTESRILQLEARSE
ncbi:ExbD/TolR family protein [Tropicimonas sp. S265A]|uniref:ExbD/TolR family protein n=1 Tax=Tropicimonas sp. S265A TaxID=3415134 RepID=UPI003C7EBD30